MIQSIWTLYNGSAGIFEVPSLVTGCVPFFGDRRNQEKPLPFLIPFGKDQQGAGEKSE